VPILLPSSEPLSEDAARFLAIGRCADGIRHFAAEHYGPDQIAAGMATALATAMPQRNRRALLPPAARLLRIGWQHELAARLGDVFDDPTMRRAMAHNLPGNAYYALFSARRALNQIRGSSNKQHTGIHKEFANSDLAIMPLPWSASLTGDPEHPDQCHICPSAWFTPGKVDPMQADLPPAAYLFAALRMTRRWKLDQAREDWLRDTRRTSGLMVSPIRSSQRRLDASSSSASGRRPYSTSSTNCVAAPTMSMSTSTPPIPAKLPWNASTTASCSLSTPVCWLSRRKSRPTLGSTHTEALLRSGRLEPISGSADGRPVLCSAALRRSPPRFAR
jgi:hypothetical protein